MRRILRMFAIALVVIGSSVGPAQGSERVPGDCHEDEDWATVHYETPGAVEDSHGVTRMCIPRDKLVMNYINRLILDGTLVWEWDLPDPKVVTQTITKVVKVVQLVRIPDKPESFMIPS